MIKMAECKRNSTGVSSVVNVTTDREAHPKHWIAALVKMCTEKTVGNRLTKLGIENFVPTQLEIHQWSDRKKKIERVVIPMVIFIHTDKNTEKYIRTFSFIHKIMSMPGSKELAIIPDSQIDNLKFMLKHADSRVELISEHFALGDSVKIVRGPLKGLEGKLSMVAAEKPLIALQIECLGYACVHVLKSDIEKIV